MRRISKRRIALAVCQSALLAVSLSACSQRLGGLQSQTVAPGEVPVQIGTPVRNNVTPMEASLACFAKGLFMSKQKPLVIGVGEIKDFTGRYSVNEGNVVTQGGALMLYSALGKLGGTVRIAERFDASIGERELAYMDRRQLGNGEAQDVNGQRVPWLPYYGGTIQVSDYYITGGITEVNYNISSGGTEVGIDSIGAKHRTYTQGVAIDLRIVDTKTLLVVDTVSLSKQFTGYEIGANTFRFFGLSLFDVNIGEKAQEPLQLGIRAAIEEASIRLVARVTGLNPDPCIALRTRQIQRETSEQIFASMNRGRQPAGVKSPAPAARSAPPGLSSLNAGQGEGRAASEAVEVSFEVADGNLTGVTQAVLDRIAITAKRSPVNVVLVSRDTESLEPGQRSRLLDQRIANFITAMANRGIPQTATSIVWRPDRADAAIYRSAPGTQMLARLRVAAN